MVIVFSRLVLVSSWFLKIKNYVSLEAMSQKKFSNFFLVLETRKIFNRISTTTHYVFCQYEAPWLFIMLSEIFMVSMPSIVLIFNEIRL